MDLHEDRQPPAFLHAEPVLAVRNIAETISYWHEVLGFPDKWMWGDPPNHGGVSWHGAAFVQFSLNPKLAAASEGNSIWIRVRDLDALYALHRQKNASIVTPVENRPWGFSEYVVKEVNGYYLTFAAPTTDRDQRSKKMPSVIRIIPRTPTIAEHQQLATSVGWIPPASEASSQVAHTDLKSLLASVVFAVVAEDAKTKQAVGCALLMGDNASFYYVKDVMVHPDWQGQRIGTAMMHALNRWTEANAPNNATVGLFTGEHLASFYRQFGFMQACGMYRQIKRN